MELFADHPSPQTSLPVNFIVRLQPASEHHRSRCTEEGDLMLRPDLLLSVKASIHVVWVPSTPGAKLCQLWISLDFNAPPLPSH